jgi:tRNA(fMet)-specific endonuclease VapC
VSLLIDTDILIYSIKGNEAIRKGFERNESLPKAIAVITYGELLHGAKKSRNPEKNLAVVYRIAEIFPIVAVSRAIIETFADLKASLETEGDIIPDLDLLIASTAMTLNYTLISNNTKHFGRIKDLKLDNWYEQ